MSHTSEPQSFHALYVEHGEWLRHWLRRKLGCREQAADIAQDTFVRLLAQRQQVRLSFPRGYLSRIARSLMIDQYRRRLLEQAYLDSLAAAPTPVAFCAEQREMIMQALVQIDKLLDGLGTRTREVFLLAQLDGLKHVEIARQLGLSTNTVSKHFVRAMTHCLLLMDD